MHLGGCLDCRDELNALRGVRADLVTWAPSQPELGFRILLGRQPAETPAPVADIRWPPPRSWRAWWTPAAGLAAAAVLVLAAASAIAHVEIHRGPDGLTVRTGWGTAPATPDAAPLARATSTPEAAAVSAKPVSAVDPVFAAELDRRLRALETASHDSGVRTASMLSARSDDEILKRVRELLAQSETKQQDQLVLRIAQVIHDVDAQRVADMTQIQKGFRGIENSVTAEAAGHREVMNYLLTSTSSRQK
jgi:hypothetical protein